MQYTRPMVDLVYEIRRRVDADMKPSVKLANPEVLAELADYYLRAKDTITKTLIKELLALAGDEWLALLAPKQAAPEPAPSSSEPHKVVKVYRGQTMLVDAPLEAHEKTAQEPVEQRAELIVKAPATTKTQKMYRGQPVNY